MINKTKFSIEINGKRYAASGYLKEIDHELLAWDFETDSPAWKCRGSVDFIINDIRYTDVQLTAYIGDESEDESEVRFFPAANFTYKARE